MEIFIFLASERRISSYASFLVRHLRQSSMRPKPHKATARHVIEMAKYSRRPIKIEGFFAPSSSFLPVRGEIAARRPATRGVDRGLPTTPGRHLLHRAPGVIPARDFTERKNRSR